ncbi:MAG: penicillin acylase family protein, partial [Rudaea sp.]
MRVFLMILRRLLFALVVLAILAIAVAWVGVRASLPQLAGDASAIDAGLVTPATIERDVDGVATIRAGSRPDMAYALGYVHAQERFFAMDLMRRAAAGELSELVGAAALPMDRQRRAFRMRARAHEMITASEHAPQPDMTAYRDGVNAGLAALASRPWEYWLLGVRPQPWAEEDTILVLDAMYFDLNDSTNAHELAFAKMKVALPESVFRFLRSGGGAWDAPLLGPPMKAPALPSADDIDLRKLDPKLLRLADVGGPGPDFVGSNNFAVGGSLTANHAALVANDMHLVLRAPNIWFRARLQYPNPRRAGEMTDLIGVTLPGVPALVAGSNRHIAWGFTNSYGDWLDWVRVALDPADKSRYRDSAGWQPLRVTTETIKVHGAADETLQVRDTKWGPILAADADGTPLALAWSATQPGGTNLELEHLDVAETVDEAIETANHTAMPVQNFTVGDRAGSIGWTLAGRIPRRLGGYDAQLPSDWSQPGTGWSGWLAPSEYPRLPNPQSARIWTANARTLDFEGTDYARVGDGGFDLGARARQIRDDLQAKELFAPADFLAIQLDDRALLLAYWHDLLRDVATKGGAELAEVKKYNDDWNGRADPASVGYRLARAYRNEVTDTILDGFAAAVRQKFADFKLPFMSQSEGLVD